MVRMVDYDLRRKDVLRKTIESYFETAQPVSSESLQEDYSFDLSSATIRNVLKELEELGYLTHPHTSAGRIPTDSGYRFYIDNLMDKIGLSLEEEKTLETFFDSYLEVGSNVFENASRIISNLTHYVGIISHDDKYKTYYYGLSYLLEQPEFKNIDTIRLIFKALDDDKLFELINRKMDSPIEVVIGDECDSPEMSNCSLVICDCAKSKKRKGRLAVLGPKRMAYHQVIPMINYLSELIVREI